MYVKAVLARPPYLFCSEECRAAFIESRENVGTPTIVPAEPGSHCCVCEKEITENERPL